MFSLACDWSKHVTPAKIGEYIREYSPIFKTASDAKKIRWIINTIASIWGEAHSIPSSNALGELFASPNRLCPPTNILAYFWHQMEAIVYISLCTRLFYIFSFSASGDCEECGNYVRHIFSIVPGSLAIISLLIVLLFQHSHTTWKKNGKIVQTTCVNDYLLYTFQLPFEQLFSPIAFIWIIFFKNSVQL